MINEDQGFLKINSLAMIKYSKVQDDLAYYNGITPLQEVDGGYLANPSLSELNFLLDEEVFEKRVLKKVTKK
jgi:hypothetical protein